MRECVCVCVCVSVYRPPLPRKRCDWVSAFLLTDWLPCYYPIADEFSRALAWNETQTASSKIWTQIADYIFNDNNLYSKWVSDWVFVYVYIGTDTKAFTETQTHTENYIYLYVYIYIYHILLFMD